MLTTPENRIAKLKAADVPEEFLQALENLNAFGDFQFVIQTPEASYFYLPTICDTYRCLLGWEVTPICNGGNGDVFYALLSSEQKSKFVYFELENDEIYGDFGSNFLGLLAHLLIYFYEFSELPVNDLTVFGERMGFRNADALFQALEQASQDKQRATIEGDRNWRNTILPGIIHG
jgi:hypothetical protein